jgi:hypothetical protein
MGQGPTVYDAQGNPIKPKSYFDSPVGFNMSPDDWAASFRNINPYSDQAAASLFGGNVQNFINQGLSYTPGQGFNTFMNEQAPALAQLTQDTVGAQQQQMLEQGRRNAQDALGSVLANNSQNNALYSSFTGARGQEAAQNANLNAALQASGMYNNMLGGLYQTQLPLAQQNAMQQAQLAQGLLGMQSQFGDQMFVQPDFMQSASGWDSLWGTMNPAINAVGAGAKAGAGFGLW